LRDGFPLPGGWQRADIGIQLPSLHVPLEQEPAPLVVLAEHRPPREEHVVIAAARVDDDGTRVEREVDRRIVLLARRAQGPERSDGRPVERVLRDERAVFRLADQHRSARVLERADPAHYLTVQHDERRLAGGQGESPQRGTGDMEHLHATPVSRRVGHHERAVVGQVERRWPQDAAAFGADLNDLPHAIVRRGDRIDRMGAPIEDEELAVGRLLARGHLFDPASQMGG